MSFTLPAPPVPTKPTFNRAVDESFAICSGISGDRGVEYADSWATQNQSTHFLDLTLALIMKHELTLGALSREAKRLLKLASMCDVKISRMAEGWKDDTLIDLLNYVAVFRTLSSEYITTAAQLRQSQQ